MTQSSPHHTLMRLHRFVDRALTPFLEPLSLRHAFDSYITVDQASLLALSSFDDPQALVTRFGPTAHDPGVMIAEPSLCRGILERIWHTPSPAGMPLTGVEGEIVRQFLAQIVASWRAAWSDEGITLLPELGLAAQLSVVAPQLTDGPWHVARAVIHDGDTPLGTLLLCYPHSLLPQLERAAGATTWRARITRGLSSSEQQRLHARLSTSLQAVAIAAPIVITQHLSLGTIDALEAGDVILFESSADGAVPVSILGRELTAHLGRRNDRIALHVASANHPSTTPIALSDSA